jgi:hypothetical protein
MKYKLLADALDFYDLRGYDYVDDVPWIVESDAYYATKPANAPDIRVTIAGESDRFFAASGEQGFLQLLLDGRNLKRAVCLTPCLREEKRTKYNFFNFQKVELINVDDPSRPYLMHMIHDAMAFFEQFLPVRLMETGDLSFDIVSHRSRIELGSYGIRYAKVGGKDLTWIYGTGCAEPRLSQTMRDLEKRTML